MPQTHLTAAQYRNMPEPKRGRKYGNKKTLVDGIPFDSIHESKVYSTLKSLERGGYIRNLRRQVKYRFEHMDPYGKVVKIGSYIADFVYEEPLNISGPNKPWGVVVADAKGVRTAVYQLKKKLMLAFYGIEIKEF